MEMRIRENKGENAKNNRMWKRAAGITGMVFSETVIFFTVLVTASIIWMFRTWTGLTMNELVFHLQSPVEGTDKGIIVSYLLSCLLIAILITVCAAVIHHIIKGRKWLFSLIVTFLCVLSAGSSLWYMWNRLEIAEYSANKGTVSTFIDDNYVDPGTVDIVFPEKKRNLIYIFLESMENTYADKANGGAFGYNAILELTELSSKGENFSGNEKILNGGISLYGTTWTVGAMFGQSAGLPLLIPIHGNNMDTQEEFFPGIVTLGDILEDEGYTQCLLLGSDAAFGGRDLYYTQHGNYQILDYKYSKENGEIPEDYYVFWGYEDNRLFENAKKHLLELSASEKPFNMTMLTVDTHFEDGYVCEDCPDTFGEDQYANVMACSSKKVAEFVEWVMQQDFYENTTIVISGDHPTMDSDFCEDVEEAYQRKVYTTYINADAQVQNNGYREYSTLDNFPTTLASLGAEIEGNRLGLGTNLFSSEATLVEKYDLETVNTELQKKSALMDKMTKNITVEETSQDTGADVQEEESITGDILVVPYDFKTNTFHVLIRDLVPSEKIQAVRCAVWAKEDQSDLVWYDVQRQEDASYAAEIYGSDFNNQEGKYEIHVYVIDDKGEPVLLGGYKGEIK